MLQNAYLLAKIGADTAENERNLPKFCQKSATTLRVGAERPAQAGEVRGLDGRVDALPAAQARHHRRGDLDCVQMSSWQQGLGPCAGSRHCIVLASKLWIL